MNYTESSHKKLISFLLSFMFVMLFILSSVASVYAAETRFIDVIGIGSIDKKSDNLYTWYGLTRIPSITVNTSSLLSGIVPPGAQTFDIDLDFSEMFTFLVVNSANWTDSLDPLANDAESYTISFDDMTNAEKPLIHYGKAVSDFVIEHKTEIQANYESRSLIGKLFGIFTRKSEIGFNSWLEAIIADESDGIYAPEDIVISLITSKGYKVWYNPVAGYFKLTYYPENTFNIELPRVYITPTDYRTVYYFTNDSSYFDNDQGGNGDIIDIYSSGGAQTVEIGDKTVTNYEYNQNPVNQPTMNQDASMFWDIASGASVDFSNTAPVFDASQKQFFIPIYNNYYYTYNNYYTYYNYNYYMPGSDIPFSTYKVYFQLPDGRSSQDLTIDEIRGESTGWRCMNYTIATEDPYQQALFHFDGTIDNSGAYNPLVDFNTGNIRPVSSNIKYNVGAYSSLTRDFYTTNVSFDCHFNGYFKILTENNYGIYSQAHNCTLVIINNGTTVFTSSRLHRDNQVVNISDLLIHSGTLVFRIVWTYFEESGYITIYNSSYFNLSAWSFTDIVIPDENNPTHFEWLDNAIYQFVTTGDDNYGGALYLDGLSHKFKINQTVGSVSSGFDFTLSFRWYQELTTSTSQHALYLGGTGTSSIAYLIWTGEKLGSLGSNGHLYPINETIPVGSWNTITITRTGNSLMCFLNGLKVGEGTVYSVNASSNDYVIFDLSQDNNVKYFDEYMYANISLYTGNHIPRLQPYDTSNVLVYPVDYTPTYKTLAVKSIIPVHYYRIGGVRPSYPVYGDVYCHLDDKKYIDSCQIWNGYMWIEVDCACGVGGHWFNPTTFNVGTLEDDYTAVVPPGTIIEAPTTIWDFLNNILSPITNLLQHISEAIGGAVDSLGSLITGVLDSIKDILVSFVTFFVHLVRELFNNIVGFISSLITNIGNLFTGHNAVFSVFSDFYYAIPNSIQLLLSGAFSVVVLLGFFRWFK